MCRRQFGLTCVFVVLAAPLPLLGQVPPVRSVTFQGQVVDSLTGAPLPGAQVRLTPATAQPQQSPLASIYAQADEQGRFQFQGLVPDSYIAAARALGYPSNARLQNQYLQLSAPGSSGGVDGGCFDCGPPGGSIDGLDKASDDSGVLHVTTTIRLTPTSVIVGKVTDPNGNPLPGAAIKLISKLSPSSSPGVSTPQHHGRVEFDRTFTADDRGEFRLARVPLGSYLLVAGDSGQGHYWRTNFRPTFFPRAVDQASAKAIDLAAGMTVRADIQIVQNDGVKVSGRLVLPSGPAAAPSAYRYTQVILTPYPRVMINKSLFTMASEDQFEIPDVVPGAYTLTAVTQEGHFDQPSGGQHKAIFGVSRVVQVGAGGLSSPDLELAPLNDLTGSVKFAEGCPRPALRVSLVMDPGFPPEWRTAVPAGETTFTLSGMSPGKLRLSVMPSHGPFRYIRAVSVRLGNREVAETGFDYPVPGAPALEVTVGCSPEGGSAQ